MRIRTTEITAGEMCKITGYSEGKIRRLREAGAIPSKLIGDKKLFTLRADFEAYWSGKAAGTLTDFARFEQMIRRVVREEMASIRFVPEVR